MSENFATLTPSPIAGLRRIALQVTDLERSAQFYSEVWGLEPLGESADRRLLGCVVGSPHVLSLRQGEQARFEELTLAARDVEAVNAVHAKAVGAGLRVLEEPRMLPEEMGGGYGVAIEGPEGLRVGVSFRSDQPVHRFDDFTKPLSLTHVVLNTADLPRMNEFFTRVLGLKLSDRTDRMDFLRCGSDHHTVALAHGKRLSMNHAAFAMRDIDALMYGTGRLIEHGFEVEWGLGRHGPGNNVFCYFVDPDGFAVEYTTEMEQVDDTYTTRYADYWAAFPRRPCRWGVARRPSDRLAQAMAGAAQAAAYEQPRE